MSFHSCITCVYVHGKKSENLSRSRLHAKLLQLCPTLWDPRDCSPPGSTVHGILQARILEGGPGIQPTSPAAPALQADSLSPEPQKSLRLSLVRLFATQARTLEWVAFPFSRGSSQPRDQPRSPKFQADPLPVEPQGKPKNTGVGILFLLQCIFPTQELNWSPALQADSLPTELSGCMNVLKKKRIDSSCPNDSFKILYHLKIYTCKNIN